MKNIEIKLLSELFKDSKRSDRELARVLGVSQPTLTRIRNRLVKNGLIREFTIIPNLVGLGFELLAISCVNVKMKPELQERARKWVKKYPNVLFMAKAEGMGKNGLILSLHKNYTEFSRFATEALTFWGDDIESYDTMHVSLKESIIRPLSLRYLAELQKTSED
jgi:DNA-binding Lrp family transcriptional regulator